MSGIERNRIRRSIRRQLARAPESAVDPGAHLTRRVEDGRPVRADDTESVADTLRFAQARDGRMAMFLYPAPTPEEIGELATAWALHPVLVEDLLQAHQRPKMERYGDVLFLVVRSGRYLDVSEEVEFAEFHILVAPHAIAVLCQDHRWIDGTDAATFIRDDRTGLLDAPEGSLLGNEELLRLGSEAVVYRVLDAIVDGYGPVVSGLRVDHEQIERQVFSGDPAAAERIYRLSQEVIDTQRATSSLGEIVAALQAGFERYDAPRELETYLQDVADHLSQIVSRVDELRDSLAQILNVNATLVAQRQNEDMKKISGWAAILFAPTLVAAVYGMNFAAMPELDWVWGYPMAIALMVAFAVTLYIVFKRSKWM